MNIKRALSGVALALAGLTFAAPTLAAQQFSYFDMSKAAALSFASQARQNYYNHDIYVRYDEWSSHGGNQSLQSVFSVPDSKWKAPDFGNTIAPVPEPETYALMIAGLLVVFTVARRRRAKI